jgi:hypothetical protein
VTNIIKDAIKQNSKCWVSSILFLSSPIISAHLSEFPFLYYSKKQSQRWYIHERCLQCYIIQVYASIVLLIYKTDSQNEFSVLKPFFSIIVKGTNMFLYSEERCAYLSHQSFHIVLRKPLHKTRASDFFLGHFFILTVVQSHMHDIYEIMYTSTYIKGRSQWPRGLRRELSSLARMLRSWIRVPLKAWMSVLCAFLLCLCVCV